MLECATKRFFVLRDDRGDIHLLDAAEIQFACEQLETGSATIETRARQFHVSGSLSEQILEAWRELPVRAFEEPLEVVGVQALQKEKLFPDYE